MSACRRRKGLLALLIILSIFTQYLGQSNAIAGRSPTTLFRQLFEFRTGTRAGPNAGPMQESVASLEQDDLIAIAAYWGTLSP